jgi:malate dehydrogenase (oxaloacetate-decarboxylating)
LRPSVLVGVTGAAGAFGEAVVRAMAAHAPRPVIFPLSNPTSHSEARPSDLLAWTAGRALVATGSPFAPVSHAGRTVRIGQANNAFIFPGVGLGALVAQAREVSDGMLLAAAERLAEEVLAGDPERDGLFPPIADLRRVTRRVAEAVVRQAREEGVGPPIPDAQIAAAVASAMWEPVYPSLDAG